jgi:hypothetical protein
MNITAVYDENGRILAAVVDDGEYDGPQPVPGEGARVGTFAVPDALNGRALEDICIALRVDTASNRLVGV